MAFKPGESGNRGGRKRSLGLSRAVRASEGLKTWCKLLELRDQQGLEPKELREVCKLILAYCWGTPLQASDNLEDRIKTLEKRLNELLNVKPRGNSYHGDYIT